MGMSEYTNEELAEACAEAADVLDDTGRPMMACRVSPAARTLRAMQGKDYSAATVDSGNRVAEETPSASDAKAGSIPAGGATNSADPPPPEDALLAQIATHFRKGHELGMSATWAERQEYDRVTRYLLEQASDRIAADARNSNPITAECPSCGCQYADRALSRANQALATAEARAQGLEADARRYRWLLECWNSESDEMLERHDDALNSDDPDTAIDAALGLAPDSGKKRG